MDQSHAYRVVHVLVTVNDKRRCVGVELIGVCPDSAVLSAYKNECERIAKGFFGAEPNELVGRTSIEPWKTAGYAFRIWELMPSAATIRSASEKTTTQPKVSSDRFRSNASMWCAGSRSFMEMAR